jgi:hypothetical protein
MISASAPGSGRPTAACETGDSQQPRHWDDRRGAERFPIGREVRYRVNSRRNGVTEGVGETLNISSNGVLFTTSDPSLVAGKRVELSISWPARLDNRCHLRLVAKGRVSRVSSNTVAVAIEQYEFRTAGRATQESQE